MIRIKPRIGCLLLLVFGMGAITLLMIGYRSLMGSLPRTRGRLAVNGLVREVKVFRDGYSIPAVFAENTHDLVFAQGFVTAQDRLWQMDVTRRTARGRLSELFGRASLGTDSLMRVMGIGRRAAECGRTLTPVSMKILRAYSDGVNAFIASHRKQMPVEVMLLDYAVEPWTPEDCIAVLQLHVLESDLRWITGPVREALATGFPELRITGERGRYLLRRARGESTAVSRSLLRFLRNVLEESFLEEPSSGSLSFAVPGSRMDSGKPLFVHVPCADLRVPSPWYQAVLRSDSLNASGLTLPGFPLVWAGHNARTAWAPAPLDAGDAAWTQVLLKGDGGGGILFLSGKRWLGADVTHESINVRGDSTLRITIAHTDFGSALLSSPPGDTAAAAPALKCPLHGTEDAVTCLLRMNRAYNARMFRAAAGAFPMPAGAWLAADIDGGMGLQNPGGPGRDIRSGARMMAFADGRISDGDSIRPLSPAPSQDFRIRRLAYLLTLKDTLTNMDIRGILTDDVSLYSRRIRDRVLPFLQRAPKDGRKDPLEDQALRIWSVWDGSMKPGGPAPALAEVFFERLMDNGFRERSGEAGYALFADLPSVHLPAVLDGIEAWRAGPRDSEWFASLVRRCFHETVAALRETCGADASAWNWGVLHTLNVDHPMGGQKLLRRVFSAGPFPMGGSSTTLDCWEHPVRMPFLIRSGPSARLILRPGDWDSSVSAISTGQSGQPMDAAHYRDQLQLLLEDFYHPDLWDSDKIAQSGSNLFVLQPGAAP